MELFVVNRYDNPEPEGPQDPSNHLTQLLKRIEARKREKAAQESSKPEPTKRKKQQEPKSSEGETERAANKEQEHGPNSETGNERVPRTAAEATETTGLEKLDESVGVVSSGKPSQEFNFTILGAKPQKKKRAVKRTLPEWLEHPELVSLDLDSGPDLQDLQDGMLDSAILKTLEQQGVKKLFPIQSKLIEWLSRCNSHRKHGWRPRDTCVSAPTGSGKTLAYVLPIVEQLRSHRLRKLRCLIVLPVQELADQVYKVVSTYIASTNLKAALLTGAASYEREKMLIVNESATGRRCNECVVDIVVATPGRLIDHIHKTPGFTLDDLEFIVMDEADRSTDWLQYLPSLHTRPLPLTARNIFTRSARPAQKLLFGATLSQDPEKLNRFGLFQPILFTSVAIQDRDDDVDLDAETSGYFVGRYASPAELQERAVECPAEWKPLALLRLLTESEDTPRSFVFTNSGVTAHRLALLLQLLLKRNKDVRVGEISAQLNPKQRKQVLESFSQGRIRVLVSSDALARGVDVAGVKLVVSYDLPKHIKGYIHRAGRTGRAGVPGTAVSILGPKQLALFRQMLLNARKTVPTLEQPQPELEELAVAVKYRKRLKKLEKLLQEERDKLVQKSKANKRRRF